MAAGELFDQKPVSGPERISGQKDPDIKYEIV